MAQGSPRFIRDSELRKLKANQQQLRQALKLLFDLLESHAPMWYTKKHHDKAVSALHR